MNENEIIEMLEYIKQNGSGACDKCPVFPCGKIKDYEDNQCGRFIAENALDLINRQKAEIERLKKEHDKNFEKWKLLVDKTKQYYKELYTESKEIIKSKAVKEFAEAVKLKFYEEFDEIIPSVMANEIDVLAKQMGGENNGNV